MFSTLYGTYFSFQMHFKMLSANCFNLDKSNISSGDGLKGVQWKNLIWHKEMDSDISRSKE